MSAVPKSPESASITTQNAENAMNEYKKIGARIREVRIKNGMSQADLSVKAHISLPHISDIELGKTKMLLATFVRITEALQVSADVLLRPDIPQVNNIYQDFWIDLFVYTLCYYILSF